MSNPGVSHEQPIAPSAVPVSSPMPAGSALTAADVKPYTPLVSTLSTVARAIAALGVLWLFVNSLSSFFPGKPLADYGWMGFGLFIASGIVIALCWELVTIARRLNHVCKSTLRAGKSRGAEAAGSSILTILRDASDKQNWAEVLTLGRPLSKPLWLTGRYQLRVQVGELVESAAAFSNQREIQATTLIDDLGWTFVGLDSPDVAEHHISRGLKIAQDIGAHHLVSRACRHLAGIRNIHGDLQGAESFTRMSEDALSKVTDPGERDELSTNLDYLRARRLQVQGNNPAALAALTAVLQRFEKFADRDRAVKVYGPLGHAYMALGDLTTARDTFRRGVALARASARRDCEHANLSGLAEVSLREEHFAEARAQFVSAAELADQLGSSLTAAKLRQRAANIKL